MVLDLQENNNKLNIILASTSKRRVDMLKELGVNFISVSPNFDENLIKIKDPKKYVETLAKCKAESIQNVENSIIIAADTIVYLDGEILEKPKDKDHARQMLKKLSNNTHTVYTGVCIKGPDGESHTFYEKTRVTFAEISENEIEKYINTNEPFDKAGGYGVQDKGKVFIHKVHGDFFNVVGFPIAKVYKFLLQNYNISLI